MPPKPDVPLIPVNVPESTPNPPSSLGPVGYYQTTLSEVLSGKFTSASDKHGTNGTLVEVSGLTVISTKVEADGDTHIVVSDGTVNPFIAEITPVEKQAGLADPEIGSVITIIGYVYWDSAHATEAWHGNTGWEIHPIKEIQ